MLISLRICKLLVIWFFVQINEFSDWLHFIKYSDEYVRVGDRNYGLNDYRGCLNTGTIFSKVNIFLERIFCNQEPWHVFTVRRTMRESQRWKQNPEICTANEKENKKNVRRYEDWKFSSMCNISARNSAPRKQNGLLMLINILINTVACAVARDHSITGPIRQKNIKFP